MSAIKTIGRCLGMGVDGSVWFFCNGCNGPHSIKVNSPGTPGPNWGYNGNPDTPTFTPSVLARTTGAPDGRSVMTPEEEAEYDAIYAKGGREAVFTSRFGKVCHSFVTDGRIQYLGDCTHALAGQTVDLPNWEESWAR
ncbi:DUF6527 family protein [Pseudomonas savastanoi pv. phaseolicola]|uniref:Ammonia monooxygenase n=2 Tax=Pseudomonas savastanoi TaxID=29438 RepID=A0A3M3FDJ5_PSESG|nr:MULTISPECIES: DUF6527 family protein [Pseudomonas]KPY13545.1 hypothetical protein ALO55_103161 [Pseudomonas savastanoi pv. phaseolicola]MBN4182180.1 hypothetical protein [Pseudomonas savastanoi pv. phaseolicola]MDG6377941.1 DUF6527 family protein [Pseudomonas savastanoi pv. phaseolicola]MDG6388373.1 DUF6527 family protein [Pseudomonas savastanoi pv. phaseolicola]ODS46307.1 MAG: ammonia monooxygenase [Pseudomonas sp. BDAL1]